VDRRTVRAGGAATVPLLSHSFSRGVAIFEVADVPLTVRGPAVFRLEAHVERFFGSCRLMHMPLRIRRDELAEAVLRTVARNRVWPCAVKFFAYSPDVEYGLIPKKPRISVAVFCYQSHPERKSGEPVPPVAAGTSTVRKLNPQTVAIHAKACGNYVSPYLATWEVREKGYDEVLMLDESGLVAEGALANAFFAMGGRVRTAPLSKVLAGITRDSVLQLLRDLEIEVAETDIRLEDALAADEGFYTGSTARIVPIGSIDGQPIGGDCPGPITVRIRDALNDAYAGRLPECDHWLAHVNQTPGP
jgi:branched-chain amino acid aminotransferase